MKSKQFELNETVEYIVELSTSDDEVENWMCSAMIHFYMPFFTKRYEILFNECQTTEELNNVEKKFKQECAVLQKAEGISMNKRKSFLKE